MDWFDFLTDYMFSLAVFREWILKIKPPYPHGRGGLDGL